MMPVFHSRPRTTRPVRTLRPALRHPYESHVVSDTSPIKRLCCSNAKRAAARTPPPPGEEVWRLRPRDRVQRCELRDDADVGEMRSMNLPSTFGWRRLVPDTLNERNDLTHRAGSHHGAIDDAPQSWGKRVDNVGDCVDQ